MLASYLKDFIFIIFFVQRNIASNLSSSLSKTQFLHSMNSFEIDRITVIDIIRLSSK